MSSMKSLEPKSMVLNTGSFIDITEHKATQDAMRESEETFKQLFEESPSGLALVDTQGIIRKVNRALLNMLGISPEILIDKNFMDLVAAFGLPTEDYRTDFKERLADRNSNIELTFPTLNGIKTTVSVQSSPIKTDGNITNILYILTDITERKKTEEALRESERKYRLLSENSADVVWTLDLNTRKFTFFSPSVQKLLGYTPEEALALPQGKSMTSESYKNAMNELKKGLAEESVPGIDPDRMHILQLEEICKDGTTVFIEANVKFLRDENGRPTSIIGSSRDVTERKRAEEALQKSEQKYRLLVDTANEAIVVAQDGMMKFVNRKAIELLDGYSEQEIANTPFPEFIHPDDRQMVVENYKRRIKGEGAQGKYAFRVIARAGAVKWVEISAAKIDWEGKPATLNFLSDITERRKADEALKESEKKFRTMMANSADAVFIADKNGNYVYTNPKATEMLGYSAEEFTKMNITDISKKEDIQEHLNGFQRLLETGEFFTEITLVKKDGFAVPTELNAVVMGNNQIYGSCRDITERKKMEEETKENLHDLERYKRATIDRELKMIELKERMKQLEQNYGV